MLQALLEAIKAAPNTVLIAIAAIAVGIVFGIPIALIRFYKLKAVDKILKWFVTLGRGVPIILIFLAVYLYAVTSGNTNIRIELLAVIALSIPSSLYLSEIFRGCLESIDKSQFDAASSIGHTGAHTFFRIIVPQMIPISLPMIGNIVVGMLKGVAIVSMVGGAGDMLSAAKAAAAINYRYLEAYVAAGIVYWVLCIGIQKAFALIEKHFNKKTRKAVA